MSLTTPSNYRFHIGIDPGVNTGMAVFDRSMGKLITVTTLHIHEAMQEVLRLCTNHPGNVYVRFEDARLRKWYGKKVNGRWVRESDPGRLQGTGSIKRDCTIWQHFLEDHQIPYCSQEPMKGMTKWSSQIFKLTTGWTAPTDDHARDAAVLVYRT